MKQVLQERAGGKIVVTDVPDPEQTAGRILVRVEASLISAGTESAQVASAGRSLARRVLDNPALLRKGLSAVQQRGLRGLREQIESKTTGYDALGYSCTGTVIAPDPAFPEFPAGCRVACGGIGHANHAEIVSVPGRLCALVPDGVPGEAAAYATLGAIAMQGVRQARAAIGESTVVIGLGLVGLLTVQLLKAAGCAVAGVDPSASARARGRAAGCADTATPEEADAAVRELSRGIGADLVLVCAAAPDSAPVRLAGELARSRGRVVMVGATGMEIPRELYFRKELSFALSRSYGPGRYDPSYEEHGLDYPVDYVRFTEQRNMQAFLDLAAAGAIAPAGLTTHRFPLDRAPEAYALLQDGSADRAGILLTYPATPAPKQTRIALQPPAAAAGDTGVGVIGAGDYACGVLLPLLRRETGIALRGIAARAPAHSLSAAKRFGFASAAASAAEVIGDAQTQVVFVATRHDTHAPFAAEALRRGRHVWVEKPAALSLEELHDLAAAQRERPDAVLTVGFNRRFSPLADFVRTEFRPGSPVMMTFRVNAGALPPGHWAQDPASGGGRLLGEGCHFFDFLFGFAGADPVSVHAVPLGAARPDLPPTANFAATIRFANGSVGQVLYTSDGHAALPKERFEIFGGGRAAVIDDFARATVYGPGGAREEILRAQDKGQANLLRAFLAAARGKGERPIAARDLLVSSALTLAAQESLDRGTPVDLRPLTDSLIT